MTIASNIFNGAYDVATAVAAYAPSEEAVKEAIKNWNPVLMLAQPLSPALKNLVKSIQLAKVVLDAKKSTGVWCEKTQKVAFAAAHLLCSLTHSSWGRVVAAVDNSMSNGRLALENYRKSDYSKAVRPALKAFFAGVYVLCSITQNPAGKLISLSGAVIIDARSMQEALTAPNSSRSQMLVAAAKLASSSLLLGLRFAPHLWGSSLAYAGLQTFMTLYLSQAEFSKGKDLQGYAISVLALFHGESLYFSGP